MTNIHNVGFYDIDPVSINRMNYEPTIKKLALSRANNSIEIWDLSECPLIERVIPGKSDFSVESLVWCNTRLFSTGLHGFILEYDFSTLKHKKWAIPSGPAWCMDIDKKKSRLAVGTDIGHINIFNIYDEEIVYEKLLDKQEGRIICIKWHDKNHLVTGSIDSLRVWNVKTGQAIDKMTTGRNAAKKETIVWCIEVTDDFTIISGDSRGKLSFWDGKMGTLIESFQTHIADILCLCLSKDQNTIYFAGIDPVISCFSRISVNQKDDRVKWVISSQNKLHSHDVNALCLKEKTIISGGVNSYLSFSSYNTKSSIKYPPFLQGSPASINECRQILLRYHTHLELWGLGEAYEDNNLSNDSILNLKKYPTKLVRLNSCGNDLILCSDISQNGKWLAYSTPNKTRLFSISQIKEEPILTKATYSIVPSIKLAFADEKLAMVTLKGTLLIIEASLDFKPALIELDIYKVGLLKDIVTHLIFSNDYLVVSDHLSNILVWATLDWKVNNEI